MPHAGVLAASACGPSLPVTATAVGLAAGELTVPTRGTDLARSDTRPSTVPAYWTMPPH